MAGKKGSRSSKTAHVLRKKCRSRFKTPSGRCLGGVFRRYRIRALPQPSKLMMRVRVSLPAPNCISRLRAVFFVPYSF